MITEAHEIGMSSNMLGRLGEQREPASCEMIQFEPQAVGMSNRYPPGVCPHKEARGIAHVGVVNLQTERDLR